MAGETEEPGFHREEIFGGLSLGTFPNSEDRKTESRQQALDIYIVLRQENSASLNSFHLKNNTSSIQVLTLLRERDHTKFQKKSK